VIIKRIYVCVCDSCWFEVEKVSCHWVAAVAGDTLATLYNDSSVLEMHHCATAFRLMQKEGCNVLEGFERKKYQAVRRIIVDLVRSVVSF